MPYFSRLTDIVTCSLSSLLEAANDPAATLEEIILEMEEGLAGARRSVSTANANVDRLEAEIEEQREQSRTWQSEAREHLVRGDESRARRALLRKQELEDLLAGLEQQRQAAIATREHLRTTQHALEARLADALRRRQNLRDTQGVESAPAESSATFPGAKSRMSRVDEELEELRRQLAQESSSQ